MQAVSTISSLSSLSLSYSATVKYKSQTTSDSNSSQSEPLTDLYLPSNAVSFDSASSKDSTTDSSNADNSDASSASTGSATSTSSSSTSPTSQASNLFQGFDLKAFEASIRKQLMDAILKAEQAANNSSSSSTNSTNTVSGIPYNVDSSQQAAAVPAEYNADNTSQRIVDFAMQFKGLAEQSGMSDTDYIKQITSAIQEGFKEAKDQLGDVPAAQAKLFNDTYQATMDKLNQALQSAQGGSTSTSTATSDASTANTDSSSQDADQEAYALPVNPSASAYSQSTTISGNFSFQYQYSSQSQQGQSLSVTG